MQHKIPTKRLSIDGIRRSDIRQMKMVAKTQRVRSPISSPELDLAHSFVKIASVALFSLVFLVGLSSVGRTVSYFSDAEVSIGNMLRAGIVSLRLSSDQVTVSSLSSTTATSTDDVVDSVDDIDVGTTLFTLKVDEGKKTLPLLYTATAEIDTQDFPGCDALTVDAWFGEDYHYQGLLSGFEMATTSMGSWQFMISVPEVHEGTTTLPSNAVCTGDIVFTAGLADVPKELTHVFSDEAKYEFAVKNFEEEIQETPAPIIEPVDPAPDLPPAPDDIPETEEEPEVPAETPAGTEKLVEEITDTEENVPEAVSAEEIETPAEPLI